MWQTQVSEQAARLSTQAAASSEKLEGITTGVAAAVLLVGAMAGMVWWGLIIIGTHLKTIATTLKRMDEREHDKYLRREHDQL